jgi:Bacterial Ig-like domain
MKIKTLTILPALLIGLLCQFASQTSRAQDRDIDSMPPVVVKTVPQAGVKNVPPGEFVIKVTFSKKMRDGFWTWSSAWENSTPDFIGDPQYDEAHRTCSVKVKLEPNKTYGFWLNSQNYHNFRDSQGNAAVPYLLVFKTRAN